jgi:hypothetical protein
MEAKATLNVADLAKTQSNLLSKCQEYATNSVNKACVKTHDNLKQLEQ